MGSSHTSSNIATLILAAGASRRMGTPKQLLKWGNTTLIGHTIQTALESRVDTTVVVLGAYAEQIQPEVDQFPVEVVHNPEWEQGLGTSIACGVSYILTHKPETEGVLVILADQPFIDTKHIDALLAPFEPGTKQIIATAYGDNKQGVPVLFDKTYFQSLLELNDDQGAKQLLNLYRDCVYAVKPLSENVDIDDPSDYERFR